MGVKEAREIALAEWRAKKAMVAKVREHLEQCKDPLCDHIIIVGRE